MAIQGEDRGPLAVGASSCPTAAALLAFSAGQLAEDELATIAHHISQCETCDQTVRSLGGDSDALAVGLRAAVVRPWPIEEPACLRMQEAAKAIPRQRDESVTIETEVDVSTGESQPGAAAKRPSEVAAPATQPAPMPAPMPVAIARYVVRSELGRGGFGAVYLAHDPDLDRLVAIKVPKIDAGVSEEMIQRFLEEARTAARLKHPGIIAVYEVGREVGGSCYIVMEYVEGPSLAAELAKGRLPLERAVQIVAQAAAAVHYAHKKGLVHRDLKPRNILLDAEGHVKIADFGLALHEDQQWSRAGEQAGTLAYMSPEQVRGDVHRLDGRSDVWSLGVLLYELLTGRRPFAGTPQQVTDEILHRLPKPPRQIDDKIPLALEDICLKCLSKDMGQRYSSAGDVAAALAQWSKPTPRLMLPRRPLARWTLAAIGLVACAAAAIVGVNWWRGPGGPFPVDHEARPYVPLSLMDRPPEKIFPKSDPADRWEHRPRPPEVWMDSPAANLLGLATTRSQRFKLRLEITKNDDGGYAGVFLGLRPLPPEGKDRQWQCQLISLHPPSPAPSPASGNPLGAYVQRELLTLIDAPPGTFTVQRKRIATAPVGDLVLDHTLLEVMVKGGEILEVRCGGRILSALADSTNPRVATAPTCEGRLGLFNSAGATTFRNATFESLADQRH